MPSFPHYTARLPRHLLEEIGAHGTASYNTYFTAANSSVDPSHKRLSRCNSSSVRKERRKAARVQKKTKDVHTKGLSVGKRRNEDLHEGVSKAHVKSNHDFIAEKQTKPLKSILKTSKAKNSPGPWSTERNLPTPSPPPPARPSKGIRDRLATDNAEIAALEKALGIKKTKTLPKSFEHDGLDVLLEGLDDTSADGTDVQRKRKRGHEDDWLQRKRQKALNPDPMPADDIEGTVSEAKVNSRDDDALVDGNSPDEISDEDLDGDMSFEDFSENTSSPEPSIKRVRENPYVAPAAPAEVAPTGKYMPPSSRDRGTTATGDLSRLRRRMQGLLNRLSEANLQALIKDFEELYRKNPRQDVSSTLLDLLLDLLADPATLQDTFVILHAGFIAALYKVIGSDFGAQAVSRIDDEFENLYQSKAEGGASSKKMTNLVSLLAQLYNFRMIGSSLIYDLIRLFIEDLSETNTELLLKITRSESHDTCFHAPRCLI